MYKADEEAKKMKDDLEKRAKLFAELEQAITEERETRKAHDEAKENERLAGMSHRASSERLLKLRQELTRAINPETKDSYAR